MPSTSWLPSLGRDPLVWGYSHLLIPLCLLAIAQSLFSWFNLVLSAQYVTVEQLSGILHASAASPPGCAPPAPSSSVCTTPALPPPPPSLSSPSGSAEVRAPSPSLCLAISGGDGDARDRVSPSLPARYFAACAPPEPARGTGLCALWHCHRLYQPAEQRGGLQVLFLGGPGAGRDAPTSPSLCVCLSRRVPLSHSISLQTEQPLPGGPVWLPALDLEKWYREAMAAFETSSCSVSPSSSPPPLPAKAHSSHGPLQVTQAPSAVGLRLRRCRGSVGMLLSLPPPACAAAQGRLQGGTLTHCG